MGRANWRMYLVILMALLVFNGIATVFQSRSADYYCGSLVHQSNAESGSCSEANTDGWIEAIASFVLAGFVGLGIIMSNDAEASAANGGRKKNPPTPPDKVMV